MSAEHTEHHEDVVHAHDQATEVAHAWEHFHENWKFFACFFSVVLLTVIGFNINFGNAPLEPDVLGFKIYLGSWNLVSVFFFAFLRCALIAYFMATLFKQFSFVTRTFVFSAIFLAGMILLSMWDSELRTIGDPIKDRINPPASHDVP